MKTAVLAVAKMENNYVREWTEWYKHLGFTNVIVYDNNDEKGERISDAIQDYVKSGFAIVEDFYSMTLMMLLSVDGSLLSSYMKVLKWRVLRRVLVMRSVILR